MTREMRPAIIRLTLVALVTLVLLWSGVEDQDVRAVTVLGVAIAIAAVVWFLVKRGRSMQQSRFSSVLSTVMVGSLTGALSSLITVALMLFKDIKHGHVFPDYPPSMMLAMLERLPAWTIAGGLIGLGCAFLVDVVRERDRAKR